MATPSDGDILLVFHVGSGTVNRFGVVKHVEQLRVASRSAAKRAPGALIKSLNRVEVYTSSIWDSLFLNGYDVSSLKLIRNFRGKHSLRVTWSKDPSRWVKSGRHPLYELLRECFGSKWNVLGYENPICLKGEPTGKTMFALNLNCRQVVSANKFESGDRLVFNESTGKPDKVWEEA